MHRLSFGLIVLWGLWPAHSWADLPVGSYPLPTARLSQRWAEPQNGAHGRGDVLNLQSYDGNVPTSAWSLTCSQQLSQQSTSGGINDTGNGWFVRHNQFQGGVLHLEMAPFGVIDVQLDYVITADSVQYVHGLLNTERLNLRAEGSFGQASVQLVINTAPAVTSDELVPPEGFPVILGPECQPLPNHPYGIWGEVTYATLVVEQPVPVTPVSWGQIKATYR